MSLVAGKMRRKVNFEHLLRSNMVNIGQITKKMEVNSRCKRGRGFSPILKEWVHQEISVQLTPVVWLSKKTIT